MASGGISENGLSNDRKNLPVLGTIGITNLLEMTSPAASSQSVVWKTAENVASNGFVCIQSNAVSKASSNFSIDEYLQRFRIKRRGVSPSPPYARLLVKNKFPVFGVIDACMGHCINLEINTFVVHADSKRLRFFLIWLGPRCYTLCVTVMLLFGFLSANWSWAWSQTGDTESWRQWPLAVEAT